MTFIVTIEEGEDGCIIAECPALPGCMSQGRTRKVLKSTGLRPSNTVGFMLH